MKSVNQTGLFDGSDFLAFTLSHAHQETVQQCRYETNSGSLILRANGILLFEPQQSAVPANNLIVSCGLHGNETAPIEIVNQLVTEVVGGIIEPKHRTLFILGNPQAAVEQKRFCDTNLNRLFSGAHAHVSVAETREAKRAQLIESEVAQFLKANKEQTLHYDLHTAIRGSLHEKFAVYPFLHQRQWSVTQLAFLEACGIEAVLLSHQPSSTFSYHTSTEYGAHAFTVELGKVRPFGENDQSKFLDIQKQFRQLLSAQQYGSTAPKHIKLYAVEAEIIKQSEAMRFGFSDQVKNFTAFERGTVLVEDRQNYTVEHDSASIVFPHANVNIGERALLVVRPTTIS